MIMNMILLFLLFAFDSTKAEIEVTVKCTYHNKTNEFCLQKGFEKKFKRPFSYPFEYRIENNQGFLENFLTIDTTDKCFEVEYDLKGYDDEKTSENITWPWSENLPKIQDKIIPIFGSVSQCQDVHVFADIIYMDCRKRKTKFRFIAAATFNPLMTWLLDKVDTNNDENFPTFDFLDNDDHPTISWPGIPDFECESLGIMTNGTIHYILEREDGFKVLEDKTNFLSLFESKEHRNLALTQEDKCFDWKVTIKIELHFYRVRNRGRRREIMKEPIVIMKLLKRIEEDLQGKLVAKFSKVNFRKAIDIYRNDKKEIKCLSNQGYFAILSSNNTFETKILDIKKYPKQATIDVSRILDVKCEELLLFLNIPSVSNPDRDILEHVQSLYPKIKSPKRVGSVLKLELLNSDEFGECSNLMFRMECNLIEKNGLEMNVSEILENETGSFNVLSNDLKNKDCYASAFLRNSEFMEFDTLFEHRKFRILRGNNFLDITNTTDTNNTYVQPGVSTVTIVLLVIIITANITLLGFGYHRKKKKDTLVNIEMKNLRAMSIVRQKLPDWTKKIQLPIESLKPEKEIGRGSFGIVYKGSLQMGESTEVAVKTCINKAQAKEELLSEGQLMANLGFHYNVINLLGVCVDTPENANRLLLVMEFCSEGNLLSNLQQKMKSISLNNDEKLDIGNLTAWCYQIAMGMEFLAQQNIIHGDLAARNILLDKDNNAKVGDFGKAHKLDYFNISAEIEGAQPFLWMAPEAIRAKEVTLESDKWSYGVTVWEIYSLGEHPYSNRMSTNSLVPDLKSGYRLPQPQWCPQRIYQEIILACWNDEPDHRPLWTHLIQQFSATMEQKFLLTYDTMQARNKNHYQDIKKMETTNIYYTS